MYNKIMLIIIGPSASGKTEAAKILEKKYQLKKLITHTTRNMRIGEINDLDYHFVSKETFLKMKENNKFVETMTYNNNYYGTSKDELEDNKCVVLDPKGAEAFYNLNDERIYIVFLVCDESIRKQRMLSRLDDINIINQRLLTDKEVFSTEKQKIANIVLSSEVDSPEVIADKIYSLYQNYLFSLK